MSLCNDADVAINVATQCLLSKHKHDSPEKTYWYIMLILFNSNSMNAILNKYYIMSVSSHDTK